MSHKIDKEKLHFIDKQQIKLDKIKYKGRLLDIGGGGEGIIGQLMGKEIIAIDVDSEELSGAVDGPLKILMDARRLKFLDNQFSVVTSFFTLLYISKDDVSNVFKEIYRVLEPGGEFLIWDVMIPVFPDRGKDVFVVPLEVEFEDTIIETGYGVKWPDNSRDLDFYIRNGEIAGFNIKEKKEMEELFFLKLKKN